MLQWSLVAVAFFSGETHSSCRASPHGSRSRGLNLILCSLKKPIPDNTGSEWSKLEQEHLFQGYVIIWVIFFTFDCLLFIRVDLFSRFLCVVTTISSHLHWSRSEFTRVSWILRRAMMQTWAFRNDVHQKMNCICKKYVKLQCKQADNVYSHLPGRKVGFNILWSCLSLGNLSPSGGNNKLEKACGQKLSPRK